MAAGEVKKLQIAGFLSKLRTVNGVEPDENGNVQIETGGIKTIDGNAPDENGDISVITAAANVTSITVERDNEYITVTMPLDDGGTSVAKITLNTEGFPTRIVFDGVDCDTSWSGFSDETV